MQTIPNLPELERTFFRGLSAVIEPIARAGYVSPGLVPGLVLLEVTGRRSGLTHRVPLLAMSAGEGLLVAALRGPRAQWVRNIAARPEVRLWRDGFSEPATALLLHATPALNGATPGWVRGLAELLHPASLAGWTFAVILPGERPGHA